MLNNKNLEVLICKQKTDWSKSSAAALDPWSPLKINKEPNYSFLTETDRLISYWWASYDPNYHKKHNYFYNTTLEFGTTTWIRFSGSEKISGTQNFIKNKQINKYVVGFFFFWYIFSHDKTTRIKNIFFCMLIISTIFLGMLPCVF